MTSRPEILAKRITPTLLLLLALGGALLVTTPRTAGASPCKPDGQACRTHQSCCGTNGHNGLCVNSAPPGKRPFGTCCTPTTCAADQCGLINDGSCPDMLNCGDCPAGEICGTANACETTTSTSTTSTSTTTTLPTCSSAAISCHCADGSSIGFGCGDPAAGCCTLSCATARTGAADACVTVHGSTAGDDCFTNPCTDCETLQPCQ